MKSFEQLAQSAYEAGQKRMHALKLPHAPVQPWAALPPESKQVWVAVAQQLWAEFSTIH